MIDFDALVLAPAHQAFGEQVIYLPGAGGSYTLAGVFDDHFQEDKLKDDMIVTVTRPVLNVRAAALPVMPVQGEIFRIRGRLYVVAEPPEADTVGDVRCYLRVASDAQAAVAPTAPVSP